MIALLMDVILGLVVVEAAALSLYHSRTGRGVAMRDIAANLAAGFMLLLTARLALGGAPDWALAASLFGALCAHLTDLRSRWTSV